MKTFLNDFPILIDLQFDEQHDWNLTLYTTWEEFVKLFNDIVSFHKPLNSFQQGAINRAQLTKAIDEIWQKNERLFESKFGECRVAMAYIAQNPDGVSTELFILNTFLVKIIYFYISKVSLLLHF